MKYEYDEKADCAYVRINDLPHGYSEEIDETRFVDHSVDGIVTGIELLHVSRGVDVSGLPMEADVAKLLEDNGIKMLRH